MKPLAIFGAGLVLGFALESNKDKTISEIANIVLNASHKVRKFAENRFSK